MHQISQDWLTRVRPNFTDPSKASNVVEWFILLIRSVGDLSCDGPVLLPFLIGLPRVLAVPGTIVHTRLSLNNASIKIDVLV